jgi:hypothetical protein
MFNRSPTKTFQLPAFVFARWYSSFYSDATSVNLLRHSNNYGRRLPRWLCPYWLPIRGVGMVVCSLVPNYYPPQYVMLTWHVKKGIRHTTHKNTLTDASLVTQRINKRRFRPSGDQAKRSQWAVPPAITHFRPRHLFPPVEIESSNTNTRLITSQWVQSCVRTLYWLYLVEIKWLVHTNL